MDNQLIRGDEISQSLLNAIEGSTISIIVFSERYASSGWCLDELVKIMECKNMYGQIVIPIFYHVGPTHVRNQMGNFGDSFSKLEERFRERLEKRQKWRISLKQAANLSGFDSSVIRSEPELIEDIVKDILKKMKDTFSIDFNKDLVGVESHIEEIESLLSHRVMGVYTLGIWGIGGIGKTTIASAFFKKICSQFDGSCFISNIREESEKIGGLTQLRRELFSTLLGDGNLNIWFPNFDFNFQIRRLSRKKVLIVFDDVTYFDQIKSLIGSFDRFMPGSLIIVTTRDKSVLKNCQMKIIYEMKELANVGALKLFSWYAFRQSHPDVSYEKLSKKVVQYAQGNPLVLKVLGCLLYGRNRREWECEINKLQSIPDNEIQKVLRVSYDGLDDINQEIFLDIACFFKGENKNFVVKFLDACGLFPEIGISVLVERSLIGISDDNMVIMHDLLQEMGREIVRQESVKYPENRSRLLHDDDIYEVLTCNTGTQAIEGISLDMSRVKETSLNFDIFKQMRNLRFLKFYGENKFNISGFGSEGYIFRKLRYLQWDQYPSRLLRSNFNFEKLVFLKLQESKIEQLWDGVQNLVNLKEIDLRDSKQLTELPDLSKAQNIEELILEGCSSLIEIHSSIQHLNKLVILDLSRCKSLTNLKILPCNLEELYLNGTAIEELPSSIDRLSTLAALDLQNCKRLQNLPSNLFNLKSLRFLCLSYCSNLKSLPEFSFCDLKELYLHGAAIEELSSSIDRLSMLDSLILNDCERLENLPGNLFNLKSLRSLSLSNCSNLKSLPEISSCDLKELYLDGTAIEELPSSIDRLSTLAFLFLRNCERLQNLPSNLFNLKSLISLNLPNCSNLKSLPEISSCDLEWLCLDGIAIEELPSSIDRLSTLAFLYLRNCERLQNLPSNIFNLKSLKSLYLSNCSNLKSLPEISSCNLEMLFLDGTAIEELPSSIDRLSILDFLDLRNCARLQNLPSNIFNLKSLKSLYLSHCSNLKSLPEISSCDLEELYLDGTAIEELPLSIEFLSRLNTLDLRRCSRLNSLPNSLCKLKSLTDLYIDDCSKLQRLSEEINSLDSLKVMEAKRTTITKLPNLQSNLISMNVNHWSSPEGLSELSIFFKSEPYDHIFKFRNYLKLDQNVIKKVVDNGLLLLLLTRRYCLDPSYSICYPGSEIPDYFKYQSLGSSLSLEMPPDTQFNTKSVGFVFCVIVSFGDHHEGDEKFDVFCELKVKTKSVECLTLAIWIDPVKAEHVIFGYTKFKKDPFDFLENGCYNEAVLEFYVREYSGERIECCEVVKKCGIHSQDFGEFLVLMKKRKATATKKD